MSPSEMIPKKWNNSRILQGTMLQEVIEVLRYYNVYHNIFLELIKF